MDTLRRLDYKRSLSFGIFGFTYAAGPGFFIYNRLYLGKASHLVGAGVSGFFTRLKPLQMAVLDCVVQMPFVFFPLYYVAKEFLARQGLYPKSSSSSVATKNPDPGGESEDYDDSDSEHHPIYLALRSWRENFVADATASCVVWIPLMWVAFTFVPLHLRWPYYSATGVLWTVILNAMQFG